MYEERVGASAFGQDERAGKSDEDWSVGDSDVHIESHLIIGNDLLLLDGLVEVNNRDDISVSSNSETR